MFLPSVLAASSFVEVRPGLIFWTIVTFVIVLLVLRAKAWGPILSLVEEREKQISNAIESAKRERAEAEKLLADQMLLRRWKTVRGSKRAELQRLLAANRRLFRAYVLREQLDRLWTYKTRPGVLNFLMGWFKALRWQRLPEMERLGDFLLKHIDGIAAYCDHPVRFGVVESINTTIKAVLRRTRGMRDEEILILKLKWATAHPIRSARDLARFLTVQPLYSNR